MDDTTLEMIYKRHYVGIRELIRHRVRNSADADDIAQTVFIKLASRCVLRDANDAIHWLSRVAINASIDLQRRKTPVWSPLDDPSLREASAETSYLHKAQLFQLQEAVSRLDASHRMVVRLCYFEGLTHQQIARRTGIPLGTVKTRIRRGVALLRADLAEG